MRFGDDRQTVTSELVSCVGLVSPVLSGKAGTCVFTHPWGDAGGDVLCLDILRDAQPGWMRQATCAGQSILRRMGQHSSVRPSPSRLKWQIREVLSSQGHTETCHYSEKCRSDHNVAEEEEVGGHLENTKTTGPEGPSSGQTHGESTPTSHEYGRHRAIFVSAVPTQAAIPF